MEKSQSVRGSGTRGCTKKKRKRGHSSQKMGKILLIEMPLKFVIIADKGIINNGK